MAITRFLLVWIVFSTKNIGGYLHQVVHRLFSALKTFLCWVLRFCNVRLVLAIARGLRFLGVLGREFRHQNPVATQNFHCLTGQKGRIDASWIAVRRKILEASATWAQNPKVLQQLAACTQQLDEAVAPLRLRKNAVILAPLHSISDVLAAMVGAGVTPGRASVIVSSSAEQYNARARALGGVNLSYCSIHQDSKQLASSLTSLLSDVAMGQQNLIIFPDITPDYTVQTEEAASGKLRCRLFGRVAGLHSGIVRLARAVSAQVVFYHLYYQDGLCIHIHEPVKARDVAEKLPEIIEQALQEYPHDWLLWHSHSLYFINQ